MLVSSPSKKVAKTISQILGLSGTFSYNIRRAIVETLEFLDEVWEYYRLILYFTAKIPYVAMVAKTTLGAKIAKIFSYGTLGVSTLHKLLEAIAEEEEKTAQIKEKHKTAGS